MSNKIKKVIIDGQLYYANDSKSLYKDEEKTKPKKLWFFGKKKKSSK
jgi:hypothetical protein